jgi:cell envelope opacity-associated protein A
MSHQTIFWTGQRVEVRWVINGIVKKSEVVVLDQPRHVVRFKRREDGWYEYRVNPELVVIAKPVG